MEKKNFLYDSFSDRLMLSCKKQEDKVAGSVRLLNVTLDITHDNRIVNVEIRNISEYLSSLNIDPNILADLKDAKLAVKTYNNGYLIYFIFYTKQGTIERVPYNLPAEIIA